ncbi:TolB family protein [Mucilaginibacter agri]|uniref:WD40-like Beta Propeller Repeat n=1 Tax=Mucilaginibacter agri TaxID=2695265 RepID=A0A965ZG32_9SPHI|nr:PD40 domain-containing protein [Mucilaginibacter agri]NCD69106.1 hypothetical protein [Mucilaginibacter agri]
MNAIFLRLKMLTAATLITVCGTLPVLGQATLLDSTAHPEVFAPGVISSASSEWSTSMSPRGDTVFFCRGASYWTVCYATKVAGQWTRPRVAPFSGRYNDTDPFISPDGKRLFFVSNRPMTGNGEPQKNYHLWYVDRVANHSWSAPKHLDSPVNLDGSNNYAPSVSAKGTLFFCSRGREGNKGMCGYFAKWLGDHYAKPERLILLGDEDVQDPFIAPDESYIIFLSGKDLYYSRKDGQTWAKAEKLGPQVNNGDPNSSPYISPDGKTLYYSSSRVKGFYKRDLSAPPLDFDAVEAESKSVFNSDSNILLIPVQTLNKK